MDSINSITGYAPIAALVLVYFLQARVFVTPDMLEKKHREIFLEAEEHFAPSILVDDLKEEINEIKSKIDKIYNFIMNSSK